MKLIFGLFKLTTLRPFFKILKPTFENISIGCLPKDLNKANNVGIVSKENLLTGDNE